MIWIRVLVEPDICSLCWCTDGCFSIADGHASGAVPVCPSCAVDWLRDFREIRQLPVAS